MMERGPYLEDAERQFLKLKKLADKAMAQAGEGVFFAQLDEESSSIAILTKHISGNMRSRWREFLTSDGEKPDRQRDREFVIEPEDSREALRHRWEEGWRFLFDALAPLTEADLPTVVLIRGEPHTVLQAINRQLTHYAYHVGQIVFLSKHAARGNWKSLSIPRGQSAAFEVAKDGSLYIPSPRPPTEAG